MVAYSLPILSKCCIPLEDKLIIVSIFILLTLCDLVGGLKRPPPKFYSHSCKYDYELGLAVGGGGVSKFKINVIFLIFLNFNITLEIVDL